MKAEEQALIHGPALAGGRTVRRESNSDYADRALRLLDPRERYNALTETPPRRIPKWACERAKKGIEGGEASYENDPVWKELGP